MRLWKKEWKRSNNGYCITKEFIDYPNVSLAGAANFLGEAAKSKVTLFI